MQSIETIYRGAKKIIEAGIRKESRDQGHYLTGATEESLDAENRKEQGADILEGVAVKYTEYVNQGLFISLIAARAQLVIKPNLFANETYLHTIGTKELKSAFSLHQF